MIVYREMGAADIPESLRLCRAAGWNQLPRDWEQFLRLNPHGSRLALRGDQVAGTVMTMAYGDRFAWIGMMLVDPTLQRQGVGAQLMNDALVVLRDQHTVRLDATPVGRGLYLKLGFVDEYPLSRLARSESDAVAPIENNPARPMAVDDLPAVCPLDREVFGADRRAMLEWVYEGAPRYAWIVRDEHRVEGYCFGRTGFSREYLGPVIAADAGIARQLVTACLNANAGRAFFLDAPHHDTDWLRWLASIGFTEQRRLTRMFRGENRHPGLPARQFGILGPEFG
jgi:ribosomal protein S18 acetylase RimI-like enzyme